MNYLGIYETESTRTILSRFMYLYLEISDNVTPPGAIQSQSIWPPFCLTEVLFRYLLQKGPQRVILVCCPVYVILLLKFLTSKSTAAAGFCALEVTRQREFVFCQIL